MIELPILKDILMKFTVLRQLLVNYALMHSIDVIKKFLFNLSIIYSIVLSRIFHAKCYYFPLKIH